MREVLALGRALQAGPQLARDVFQPAAAGLLRELGRDVLRHLPELLAAAGLPSHHVEHDSLQLGLQLVRELGHGRRLLAEAPFFFELTIFF